MCHLVRFGLATLLALKIAFANDSPDEKQAEETLLRNGRLRMREINLRNKLSNDELFLRNHTLQNEIAGLEHRQENIDASELVVDRALIAIDRQAIDANKRFIQVFTLGNVAQQQRAASIEASFDAAIEACHSEDNKSEPYRTMEEIDRDCDPLRKLLAEIVAIVSTFNPRTPSLVRHLPGGLGENFLQQDKNLLAWDQRLLCGGDKQEKASLVQGDRSIINLDRMIWNLEISEAETIAFNSKFPEHRMADVADLVVQMIKFRKELYESSLLVRKDCRRP